MLEQNLLSFAFQDAIDKVSGVDDYLLNNFNRSIVNSINSWLSEHPVFNWLVSHPLISAITFLIAAVLTIRLLATIYRAIANTIDRMWLNVLQFPFWLLKMLFGWEKQPKNNAEKTLINNYEITANPEQLQEIVARLDSIQQQQAQIILDLDRLKKSRVFSASNPNEVKLIVNGQQD